MTTTTTTAPTFGGWRAAELAGITYRQVDYWCRQGVLGPEHQKPVGSGRRRQLTAWDVLALRAIGRVAAALAEQFEATNVGSVVFYRHVADQVRAGHLAVTFRLAEHVELRIDITDLADGLPLEMGATA